MLTIVIQAGGESRRMGQDKGLVTFLDGTLIERVIARVAPLADELLVTTNRPEAYAFLGLPLVPDLEPARGALGGLYTALTAAHQPLVAVVACDMPFASPAILALARDLLLKTGADLAIPSTGAELREPFHAVYRRETCLPPLAAALQAGKWRVDSWFPQVQVRVITPAEIAPLDPEGLAFMNANTPEELAWAIKTAANESGP